MTKSTNEIGTIPAVPKEQSIGYPVDVVQLLSEVPSGIKPLAEKMQLQLTPRSIPRSLRRNPTIAMHWLNLPLQEGLVVVPMLYRLIRDKAENYQREYNQPFFLQYRDLLILTEEEKAKFGNLPDNQTLMQNVRMYAMRVAHRVWHYMNGSMMLVGSLCNLLTMSRLNGKATIKDIASAFRWSDVNTKTNVYTSFIYPKDVQEYVFGNAMVAVGKSKEDASFLSLPLYITDVFGSRGNHAISPSSLFTVNKSRSEPLLVVDPTLEPDNDTHPDWDEAEKLLLNEYLVANSYGYFKDVEGKAQVVPHMPSPMNGSEIICSDEEDNIDNPTGKFRLNSDGTPAAWDEIVQGLWANWRFWQGYMLSHFADFTDLNSDWVQFFTREIPLFETAVATSKALSIVHSAKNTIDANDLLKLMKYKMNNAPTTATTIKWMPIVGDDTGTNFKDNYERYPFDKMDTSLAIAHSRQYPRLTPTTFFAVTKEDGTDLEKPHAPLVENVAYFSGKFTDYGINPTDDTSDPSECVVDPIGFGAVLLDLASSANSDTASSNIKVIGLESNAATDYIKSGSAIVFEEDPSNFIVARQPLIDTTDPFQCGFNILISENSENKSDWEEYLTDYRNLPVADVSGIESVEPKLRPFAVPTSDTQGSDYYLQGYGKKLQPVDTGSGYTVFGFASHTANDEFMKLKKHALVFVGVGLRSHPIANVIDTLSSYLHSTVGPEEADTKSLQNWTKFGSDWAQLPVTLAFGNSLVKAASDIPVGSEGDTFDENLPNNSKAFRSLIKDTFANGRKLGFNIFSSSYPPVNYAREDIPVEIQYSVSISLDDVNDRHHYRTGEIGRVLMGIPVRYGNGRSGSSVFPYSSNQVRQPVVISRGKPIWFISSIAFRPSFVNPKNGVINYAQNPCEILFADEQDQAAALLQHSVVTATGAEDTVPFWTALNELNKRPTAELPSTPGLIPESGVMVEPRQTEVRKGTTYNARSTSNSRLNYEGNAVNSDFSGKTSGSKSCKRGKGYNKKYQKQSNDRSSDSSEKGNSSFVPEIKESAATQPAQDGKDNAFDPTTSSFDGKVKKRVDDNFQKSASTQLS